MTDTADNDAALWMPVLDLPEASRNGRPINSHERHLDSDLARDIHIEHVQDFDALCMVCGCCWCCDDDCCAEYVCPNPDCGCSDKPIATCVLPPEVIEQTP